MKFNMTQIWLMGDNPAFRRLAFIELNMVLMVLAATALVLFGSWRRRSSHWVLNGTLWVSYSLVNTFLFANTIGQMQGAPFRNELFALWGMILVILFGCADSFSAYSPADNEQWQSLHLQLLLRNFFVGVMVGLYLPPTDHEWVRRFILFFIFFFTSYKAGERIAASEMATKSFLAEHTKYIADFMSREHEILIDDEPDPTQMKGYNYLVSGETQAFVNLPKYENLTEEVVTLHKIWQFQGRLLTGETGQQLKDICLSFALYKLLCRRFGGHPFLESSHVKTWRLVRDGLLSREGDYERAFRVIEVELCFLFDLFYTKYAAIFKGGQRFTICRLCDALFVITGCVIVLVVLKNYKPSESEFYLITAGGQVVDKIATCFTVGFILLMEIAQLLFLFPSDWGTVLLICNYVKGNSWLHNSDSYPMLWTKCFMFCQEWLKFKPWERKLGQYSLLKSFHRDPYRFKFSSLYRCVTCWTACVPRKGRKGETRIKLPEEVKKGVILTLRSNDRNLSNGEDSLSRNEVLEELSWACRLETPTHVILVWHVATSLCEFGPSPVSSSNENFKIASALSCYCAYLVGFAPRLICTNATVSVFIFDRVIQEARDILARGDSKSDIYQKLMNQPDRGGGIIERGAALANDLQKIQNDERDFMWKVLADFWEEYMLFLSPSGDPMAHVEHLAKGGEFVTHLWALLSHAGILNSGSTLQDV